MSPAPAHIPVSLRKEESWRKWWAGLTWGNLKVRLIYSSCHDKLPQTGVLKPMGVCFRRSGGQKSEVKTVEEPWPPERSTAESSLPASELIAGIAGNLWPAVACSCTLSLSLSSPNRFLCISEPQFTSLYKYTCQWIRVRPKSWWPTKLMTSAKILFPNYLTSRGIFSRIRYLLEKTVYLPKKGMGILLLFSHQFRSFQII